MSVLLEAGRYGSGRTCAAGTGPVPSRGTPKDCRADGATPGIMSRASRPAGVPADCGQPSGPAAWRGMAVSASDGSTAGPGNGAGAGPPSGRPALAPVTACKNCPASAGRRSGFLLVASATSASRDGGRPGTRLEGGGTASFTCLYATG